jgi:hypothetical protein
VGVPSGRRAEGEEQSGCGSRVLLFLVKSLFPALAYSGGFILSLGA